jgi:hypothetical protein
MVPLYALPVINSSGSKTASTGSKQFRKQNCKYRQYEKVAAGLESLIILKVLERCTHFVSDVCTHVTAINVQCQLFCSV